MECLSDIISDLGGHVLIISGLLAWLGKIQIQRTIEKLKSELAIHVVTFEKKSHWMANSYSMMYEQYQAAMETKHWGNHEYWDNLERFGTEWNKMQAQARLFLPIHLLQIHENLICKFNELRFIIERNIKGIEGYSYDNHVSCLKELHELKNEMEKSLRDYLRTDSKLNL